MEKVRPKLFGDYNPYSEVELFPLDMQGWSSQHEIFEEVIAEVKPELIVEVGTWKGGSAIHMANICKKLGLDTEIVCIDTFQGSVEHWDGSSIKMNFKRGRPDIYDVFLSNVKHNNHTDMITPFPIDSINGALTLKRLGILADIVYIDAGHEYTSVFMDLLEFAPLVRPAGRLIGDDYFYEPVRKATVDIFGADKVIDRNPKFVWIK